MCYKSVLIKNVIVQPSLCLGVLNRKNRYPPQGTGEAELLRIRKSL